MRAMALRITFVLCVSLMAMPSLSAQSVRMSGEDEQIVSEINRMIKQGWEDNDVKPSARAADGEWLRRVTLDVHGHIPTSQEVAAFSSDKDKAKRQHAVLRLLDHPDYVKNWTTVWTNLMIGQGTPDRTSREGMQKYLRESLAKNKPWNEMVFDLVTAEGRFDENGAVNYLLSQMQDRDGGVQATAKTTRLFLGIQVQCTQCHNHPFNEWQHSQFWEFNSFLKEARRVDHRKLDPASGRQVDDYSELQNGKFDGPVYFEKRNGVMQVAYPNYFGKQIGPDEKVNRRMVFGELLRADEERHVARAFVNRMWAHFFGYGFTRPVDDIGPHNPPSNPELLEFLTAKFAESNYNVKQLMAWIVSCESYQLESKFSNSNEIDNPAAGESPLFSRMYVKAMTAEQVYDSMLVATLPAQAGELNLEQAQADRQRWLQQFITTFGTDENDESTNFNGTIPQALMMMNGELINRALAENQATRLQQVIAAAKDPNDVVQELYQTVLSRSPTRAELNQLRPVLNRKATIREAYEDLYWALLNSNEFQLIY